ncbi:AAA family ATPase [Candidatus Borrarchaeum sp.]|uniref:AAA family ATPase n=1 Tax=Candidatus Borrarchaeum sp. TaxID=2846742 RepID=UPI00257DB1AC|nr:AAA family ATPase [Candidatus Borrarchaeum sp.]
MNKIDSYSKNEIEILVRARYPVIYIVSWEEGRVLESLSEVAQEREKEMFCWSITEGIKTQSGKEIDNSVRDPLTALDYVYSVQRPLLFVLKDFHPYLKDPQVIRRLRDCAEEVKKSNKTIIVVSPVLEIPVELEKLITVIDYQLPSLKTLERILRGIINSVKDNPKVDVNLDDLTREQILKSALGLTMDEAENVFAKSLVVKKTFDPELIISEKEQIIRKSGILEYFHSTEKMENVGGLENLKEWVKKRTRAFTEKARNYGLPQPKGILLIGVQGCGKSLTAKAVASLWKLPLLRLDVGKIFSGVVGSSEANVRRALNMAESIAPAILWIDEIEKGLSGVQSSGQTDSGVTARVFGSFITWLQEKESPVFVIATANNIEIMPPELLRKGRFDEIFFIDLPSVDERKEIIRIHLAKRRRDPAKFDVETIATKTNGFSGAEIEEAIISAMYDAFAEERELEAEDVLKGVDKTVPLSKTMKEKVDSIRQWARTRAVFASAVEEEKERKLQLEI